MLFGGEEGGWGGGVCKYALDFVFDASLCVCTNHV